MRIQRFIPVTAVLTAGLLAACGEAPTPPQVDFNVPAASDAHAAVSSLVDGTGMSSVAALSGRLPMELGGGAPSMPGAVVPGLAGIAQRLLRSLPGAGGPLTAAVVRPQALGRTYVYDPGTRRYVPAPARPGAPVDGVRFILYPADPVSHELNGAVEIGFADLVDRAPPGLGAGLGFRAVVGGRTVLEYEFMLTPTLGGGTLRVSGMLQDEHNRLDFLLGAVTQLGGGVTTRVTFAFDVAAQQFHAEGTIHSASNSTSGQVEVDMAVDIRGDVIQVTGTSNEAAVDVRVSVNSQLFATITGNPHSPKVRGSGGRALSAPEMLALGRLIGVVYGVIEMFEHLLEPVAVILGVALWL